MEWKKHIAINPAICHGQAVVKGTRIPVFVILDNLAAGIAVEDILKSYPTLSAEGILAAIAYAAEIARERIVEIRA